MAFVTRPLSPVGFGAFKIGRNVGIKYERDYELPDMNAVRGLLNGVLDAGINYIDTAPAYGLSEERIGEAIGHRRAKFILSTKVGETFSDGVSRHDFSAAGVRASVEASLRRLRSDVLDLVFLHASRDDLHVVEKTDAVATLMHLRDSGLVRGIGLSGYTPAGLRASFAWASAIMVEYHPEFPAMAPIIAEAAAHNILVVVKKGLQSGRQPPSVALPWILSNPAVATVVVGSLDLSHIVEDLRIARAARPISVDV